MALQVVAVGRLVLRSRSMFPIVNHVSLHPDVHEALIFKCLKYLLLPIAQNLSIYTNDH